MLIITASSLRQKYRLLKVIAQLLLDSYVKNTNKHNNFLRTNPLKQLIDPM